MKWLDRKREFVRRKPQLSLFISFIKGLIVGLYISAFMGSILTAQTYTVGDTVSNFSDPICANGEGDWDYNTDGRHKITWINIFTSW